MKAERKKQVEEGFANADTTEDGKLSMDEFKTAMTALADDDDSREKARNEGFLESMMAAVDRDGDRMVTSEELISLFDEQLNYEQMITNLVKYADKDGDGLLNAGELKSLLMKMDPEEEDQEMMVDMVISICSHDETRKVKPEAALSFIINGPKKESPKEEALAMFSMFDTNTDGYIARKEVAEFCKAMMSADAGDDSFIKGVANMMLGNADKDEDGKLNYEEFKTLMANM